MTKSRKQIKVRELSRMQRAALQDARADRRGIVVSGEYPATTLMGLSQRGLLCFIGKAQLAARRHSASDTGVRSIYQLTDQGRKVMAELGL